MDKRELLRADKSSDAVRRRRRRIQMVQNVLLIWLNNNITTHEPDYDSTITQLRSVINSVTTFDDQDQCLGFLTNISGENVCIIISGILCHDIVPRIHDLGQVHTIFIFCENKTEHEKWAESWYKIQGVFTEISCICEALKQVSQQCEQNCTPISFIDTNDNISKRT